MNSLICTWSFTAEKEMIGRKASRGSEEMATRINRPEKLANILYYMLPGRFYSNRSFLWSSNPQKPTSSYLVPIYLNILKVNISLVVAVEW